MLGVLELAQRGSNLGKPNYGISTVGMYLVSQLPDSYEDVENLNFYAKKMVPDSWLQRNV